MFGVFFGIFSKNDKSARGLGGPLPNQPDWGLNWSFGGTGDRSVSYLLIFCNI